MVHSLSSSGAQLERAPIGFLFLGESLLVPHLFPIVAALGSLAPDLPVDLWVRRPDIEAMIASHVSGAARIRRAPGYGDSPGNKLLTLARLTPRLLHHDVVVCAELTSLWVPRILPLRTRFIKTSHGVGSMSARDDPRRRAAYRLLVPSERERETYLRRGHAPEEVIATGYAKASWRRSSNETVRFADEKPVVIYAPHWQRHRSSWWDWGRQIVATLEAQDRFNVILAPHQRLEERDPEVRAIIARAARLPHVHADIDSPAQIDGAYLAAADIYLGDTSSQVVEFLAIPRPCLFLNSQGIDWRATDDHDFWRCGEVIDDPARVWPAIETAAETHPAYRAEQERFATDSLGDCGPGAPLAAARAILAALR